MRLRSLLTLLLLPTALATSPAAQGHLPPRSGSPRDVIAPSDYVARRRALPDSVLLRLTRDGHSEDITRRRFERAVRLLGGNPESLTPQERDRFLENVIEQRLIAGRAHRARLAWTAEDSARFRGERERILLSAAMADRMRATEDRRRALGQPDLDRNALGIAARESLMVELAPVWDEPQLQRLAQVFAALPELADGMTTAEMVAALETLPRVAPGDSSAVLARCADGDLTVSELLVDWSRILPSYRPRVTTADEVRAVGENALFERLVRRAALEPAFGKRPEVAAGIADREEFREVNALVQGEVLAGVAGDTASVRRFFASDSSRYAVPAHVICILVTLEDSSAADRIAQRFRVPGEAESLAFRAQRAGTNYTKSVREDQDPRFFAEARALGVGGVGGPIHMRDGWLSYYVLGVEPQRLRSFAEAFADAQAAWYDVESDRLLRAMLAAERRATRIERNEPALRRLVPAGTGR